jgi:hypothetical protein
MFRKKEKIPEAQREQMEKQKEALKRQRTCS